MKFKYKWIISGKNLVFNLKICCEYKCTIDFKKQLEEMQCIINIFIFIEYYNCNIFYIVLKTLELIWLLSVTSENVKTTRTLSSTSTGQHWSTNVDLNVKFRYYLTTKNTMWYWKDHVIYNGFIRSNGGFGSSS